ncbi:MAG: hypothetical protein ACQEP3_00170 [Patescibacteria group bacterium]
MDNIEEELKKQGEKIEEIQKNIKTIKRFYLVSFIIKIIIIAIPIIGLLISIPYIMELYEEILGAITV